MDDPLHKMMDETAKGISRRNFIKGVIGSGVAVSSANYLFRASTVFRSGAGQPGGETDHAQRQWPAAAG